MMKFNRLYSGLYYSECNAYMIERKGKTWELYTGRAHRDLLATYATLAECKAHADRHDAHYGGPFGIRACIESIEFSRDALKQSAAEIVADLYRSEELNGYFFNSNMFEAFEIVFPEFPICRDTLREYWAVSSASEDNLTDAAAHMVRLINNDLTATAAEELPEETPAEEPAHTLTAMTCADLDELSREARIATRENLTSAADELEHVYRITRDCTPAETVAAFVAAVGYDDAVAVVATLVNRYAWDGRISRRVSEWAARVPSSFDADAALRLGVFSDRIHRAHLDQIAEALMQYTPEQETETVEETPATLTASDAVAYSFRVTCPTTGEVLESSEVFADRVRAKRKATHFAETLGGECVIEMFTVARDGSRAADLIDEDGNPRFDAPTTTTAPEAEKEHEAMTTTSTTAAPFTYLTATTADVVEYIRDEIDATEYADRDALAEFLHDELWIDDGVTGNASGSYTFNRARAREYVLADFETVAEALREFCVEADEIGQRFLSEDWEWLDVTARCYVLGQAIEAALDQLAEELTYAAEDEEE